MSKWNEQYDILGTKSSWRKWKRYLKRMTSRYRRRDGKKNLEDALPRATAGWVD